MEQALTCAECGAHFTSRWPQQRFCCEPHKQAFHRLMAKRGQMIMPFLIASAEARRYRDAADPELAAYAKQQADALISGWVVEDRRAGRSCALLAQMKHGARWSAADALSAA
jgi:hypothetical protein